MAEGGKNRDELVQAGGDGHNDDRNMKPVHIASSATPQATESAPAHRSAVTFSLRTSRARTVSSATLAAVTGTEKLRSATESSFMKAKNEIAMKKTASTRGPRCASPRSMPASRPGRKSSTATVCRFISKLCSKSASTVDPTMIPTISHFMASTSSGRLLSRGVSRREPDENASDHDESSSKPALPGDQLAEKHFSQDRAQHIADGSDGQHVAQIRPAQKRHARQQPENQERGSEQDPGREDEPDISERRETQIGGLVLHAPGHREISENVGRDHKRGQELGLEVDSPYAGAGDLSFFHHSLGSAALGPPKRRRGCLLLFDELLAPLAHEQILAGFFIEPRNIVV